MGRVHPRYPRGNFERAPRSLNGYNPGYTRGLSPLVSSPCICPLGRRATYELGGVGLNMACLVNRHAGMNKARLVIGYSDAVILV